MGKLVETMKVIQKHANEDRIEVLRMCEEYPMEKLG
jgi:hypothetical protein